VLKQVALFRNLLVWCLFRVELANVVTGVLVVVSVLPSQALRATMGGQLQPEALELERELVGVAQGQPGRPLSRQAATAGTV
jgi:hypothetical protein